MGHKKKIHHSLRNAFFLATTDTTNRSIAHLRILNVFEPKQSGQNVHKFMDIVGPGLIRNARLMRTCAGGEMDGLRDSESGEMQIILRAILDIATIRLRYLLWRKRVVVHVALD